MSSNEPTGEELLTRFESIPSSATCSRCGGSLWDPGCEDDSDIAVEDQTLDGYDVVEVAQRIAEPGSRGADRSPGGADQR